MSSTAHAGENVEILMENRWRAFEEPFWKELGIRGRIRKPRIDFFLSDTLAAETGREILQCRNFLKTLVGPQGFEPWTNGL